MRRSCRVLVTLAILCASNLVAQSEKSETLVVLPFENRSHAPGLDWLGEAFSEVLSQRLASPTLYVIPRKDRRYAFERLGVPQNVALSRATLFKIAEQIDVDKALLGSYSYDGGTFHARAQVLDMRSLRSQAELTESGPHTKVLDVMSALVW